MWNNKIRQLYLFHLYQEPADPLLRDDFLDLLSLQCNEMHIQEYAQIHYGKKPSMNFGQSLFQQFILEQQYFCIQNSNQNPIEHLNLTSCLSMPSNSSNYYMITQDLNNNSYPNILSYLITQFGIATTNEIFYTNFLYGLVGIFKNRIKITSLLPYLNHDSGVPEIFQPIQ